MAGGALPETHRSKQARIGKKRRKDNAETPDRVPEMLPDRVGAGVAGGAGAVRREARRGIADLFFDGGVGGRVQERDFIGDKREESSKRPNGGGCV